MNSEILDFTYTLVYITLLSSFFLSLLVLIFSAVNQSITKYNKILQYFKSNLINYSELSVLQTELSNIG